MSPPAYKHIIWDWNGTLLDDCALCVDVMNGVLQSHGMPVVSCDDYREHFDFPVRRYYTWLGFSEDATFERVSHAFIDGYTDRCHECPLHDGAAALVRQLHQQGIGQIILSAHKQDSLEAIVAHHGLHHYFDKLLGLDNIYAAGKTENGRAHFATLQHAPHEVLLIGDTLHDAEVAQALGADCILLACGHQSQSRLQSTGHPVLPNLHELSNYLSPPA